MFVVLFAHSLSLVSALAAAFIRVCVCAGAVVVAVVL